jgi:acetyl esterase/lipase
MNLETVSVKRRGLLLPLLVAGLSACSPTDLLNASVPGGDVTVMANVAYGAGPRRTLDVYRPTARGGALPLIVFLYGGSWRTGSKDMYPFVGRPLAQRGAVVVVPDYRLYPEVQFPAFLEDNAAAVAWAFAHAEAFGADPTRVFLLGHSAGAYNVAMLGLDGRYLGAVGIDRARLAGVAGLAGPYDFLPITDPDVIPVFASVDDGPASQPITYVDGRNPPMLLLAGTDDRIVDPANSKRLAARIQSRGGIVRGGLYPGIGHIGLITAFTPLFAARAPVLADVWQFVASGPPARG